MSINSDSGELFSQYQSGPEGLTGDEASRRLQTYGKNALQEKKKRAPLLKVWDQINDPMILVLLAAAGISGLLGELTDMLIIIAVVALNTVIGLVQESKAEKAIEALKKMSAQQAHVFRDGILMTIPAEELVPGDVVTLDAGDLVPADLKLLESSNLKIEEASLTGESVPSEKNADVRSEPSSPLGDRLDTAFYGTNVTYGRGRGIVYATGMKTEMGRIATIINEAQEEQTPLQKKLGEIGRLLTILVLAICVVVFLAGIIKNGGFTLENTLQSFMISVSLAVAAIPEGLPAVVTIVMAMGVTRMASRRAIIKKLPAVETLGCTEVICSDKTGTLTQNKMNVRELYAEGCTVSAEEISPEQAQLVTEIIYLCNDSTVSDREEIGDPTETALKRFALKKFQTRHFSSMKRLDELPFDSVRKMMSTVNETSDGAKVLTKGAPDQLLERCTHVLKDGKPVALDEGLKANIMKANHEMAAKALRVLGAAYKPYETASEITEESLIFVGLVGMIDPPRPEVFDAIVKCRDAGITPIMITGDHKDTAVAIANEIGMTHDPSEAIFGSELDDMSDEELAAKVENIRVYSRVSPEHKVRIVSAWRSRDKIVAMTGDGVNDAPALKVADIGVGMGITGTDVSKGVSDMLLSDDNFATIVDAVEEGRKIYINIRKAVQFLLASNISEVIAIFLATLMLPPHVIFLGPVHILWINLVTDSIPAIGLGMSKAETGIMSDRPRNARDSFFAGGLGLRIFYQGAIMGLLTLASYFIGYQVSPEVATTMAFITLSFVEIFFSFEMKASKGTIFTLKTFDNPVMLVGAVVPFILTALINTPVLAKIFSVVPLDTLQWVWAVGLAFAIIPILELIKGLKKLLGRS